MHKRFRNRNPILSHSQYNSYVLTETMPLIGRRKEKKSEERRDEKRREIRREERERNRKRNNVYRRV